jgi:hypothetical protein
MSVDEFMINYIFATRREKNQGFQDKYHKWLMHGSRYTQLKHHCCTMKTITHTCDKSRKTLATKHREEEEGNNKAIISYTYHTLCFNEVLYKTLT